MHSTLCAVIPHCVQDYIGSKYIKCLYVGYTDNTFSTKIEREEYLGFLGPIIHAAVGDRIVVNFRNKCVYSMTANVSLGPAPEAQSPWQLPPCIGICACADGVALTAMTACQLQCSHALRMWVGQVAHELSAVQPGSRGHSIGLACILFL